MAGSICSCRRVGASKPRLVLYAQENVVSETINGRPELQNAKDDLEALLPTIDPACDLLKRMIKTPDTPYGSALGPLRKPSDDAHDIIRSVYPNDEPDFPRALGLAGEPCGTGPRRRRRSRCRASKSR
jgi:hypothetical protein